MSRACCPTSARQCPWPAPWFKPDLNRIINAPTLDKTWSPCQAQKQGQFHRCTRVEVKPQGRNRRRRGLEFELHLRDRCLPGAGNARRRVGADHAALQAGAADDQLRRENRALRSHASQTSALGVKYGARPTHSSRCSMCPVPHSHTGLAAVAVVALTQHCRHRGTEPE